MTEVTLRAECGPLRERSQDNPDRSLLLGIVVVQVFRRPRRSNTPTCLTAVTQNVR